MRRFWLAKIGIALLAFSAATHGQTFSLDWATIDAGGGTSTGRTYSVTGTIGQFDAGLTTGGSYALLGGFWILGEAIEIPASPVLSARLAGQGSVVISWPQSATGFELEQTSELAFGTWVKVTSPPALVGFESQVILPTGSAQNFYRLRKR